MNLIYCILEEANPKIRKTILWAINLPSLIYFKLYNAILHAYYPQWNGRKNPSYLIGLRHFKVGKGTTFDEHADLAAWPQYAHHSISSQRYHRM